MLKYRNVYKDVDSISTYFGVKMSKVKETIEKKDFLEDLQRVQAEFENYIKRVEREKERDKLKVKSELLLKLIQIKEDLEKALENVEDKGIEMIYNNLKKILEEEEVKEIKKTGKHFIVTLKGAKKLEGKAVIIASGADPRSLNLKGEQEFIGRGLSYCVHCDGPLFFDKTVAVIGGGNSGLEAALFLSSVAKKIYILEYGEALKADRENQEKIKNIKKIEIITNVALKEIKGKQFVNEIVYQDRKTKKDVVLPLEGIFVEIGYQPATAFVKNLADFTEKQEIKTDMETFQTKTPGLFVAGDAKAGKYKQIVIAAGEGAKAALSAFQYLKNEKLI